MINSLRCIQQKSSKEPQLSILVRIKNEARALPEFWRRLESQTIFDQLEVIFLDSGSSDGSLEFLKYLPVSVYAIDPEDFNFGSSCNLLVSLSHAPSAAFLSGHVLLEQQTALESLLAVLKSHPFAAAFLRQIPNTLWGATDYERAFLAKSYKPGQESVIHVTRPDGFSNAASGFTRASWERFAIPEMNGWEDRAWVQEHLALGGQLYYLPNITVMHSHGESPEATYRRVVLNVQARKLRGSYLRFFYYLAGVFVTMLLHGSSLKNAKNYALAHARAYLPS